MSPTPRPHLLGVDDAPFDKGQAAPVPLVGVVMEGPDRMEAVALGHYHAGYRSSVEPSVNATGFCPSASMTQIARLAPDRPYLGSAAQQPAVPQAGRGDGVAT